MGSSYWITYFVGFISASMIYALMTDKEEEELEVESGMTDNSEMEINDFKARHVTLSCQTCRKLKKHREVETNLFQCTKCKRHVDLRSK